MKTILINRTGYEWKFNSAEEAYPYIRKDFLKSFYTEKREGEVVRVYDDRRREKGQKDLSLFSITAEQLKKTKRRKDYE